MRTRLAFIDTLRGFAVSAVLLQHCLEQIILTQTTGSYYWLLQNVTGHYFNFGRFGVVLFFFVSGFVIPNSFPDSLTPIRDFSVSRIFRLYPTYWLSVLLGITILPITEAKEFSLSTILANLTMFQSFINVPNIRIAYWSLAIELIFYASCICLFFAGVLKSRMTSVCAVLAICIIGSVISLLTSNHLILRLGEVALNLAAMFLGKVIRDMVVEERLNWKHVAICLTSYLTLATMLMMKLYGGHYDEMTFFSGYSMASAYDSAAVIFLGYCLFGNRLSLDFPAFVGKISYSVYLMHAYVLSCTVYWIGAGSSPLQWMRFLVFVAVISFFLSWLTYKLVEMPAIAFGRKFRSHSQPHAVAGTSL